MQMNLTSSLAGLKIKLENVSNEYKHCAYHSIDDIKIIMKNLLKAEKAKVNKKTVTALNSISVSYLFFKLQ